MFQDKRLQLARARGRDKSSAGHAVLLIVDKREGNPHAEYFAEQARPFPPALRHLS